MTATTTGTPSSSVYLYEPFGLKVASATFGTNSNPANSTNESMGWAAHPTRKQESMFTLPIIQMGARVYLPTMGRFAQVDPVEGGNINNYAYVLDPINGDDYSGEFAWALPLLMTNPIVFAIVVVAVVVVTVAAVQKASHPSVAAGGGIQSINTAVNQSVQNSRNKNMKTKSIPDVKRGVPSPPPPRCNTGESALAKAQAAANKIRSNNLKPLEGTFAHTNPTFTNKEGRLPVGNYREYDINKFTTNAKRGLERVVINVDTGEAWYTDRHYECFDPLK